MTTRLYLGGKRNGRISGRTQKDIYSFTVKYAGVYVIKAEGTQGSPKLQLCLNGPNDSTKPISPHVEGDHTTNPYIDAYFQPGEYFVMVMRAYDPPDGSYSISLEKPSCYELAVNQHTAFERMGQTGVWFYRFTAPYTGNYRVHADAGHPLRLRAYKLNNDRPVENYNSHYASFWCDSSDEIRNPRITSYNELQAGKEYLVKVEAVNPTASGSYEIGVMTKPRELTFNAYHVDHWSLKRGEEEWWYFNIEKTGVYVIKTSDTVDTFLYTGLELVTHRGSSEIVPGNKKQITRKFTPGEYILKVKPSSTSSTADYRIVLMPEPKELILDGRYPSRYTSGSLTTEWENNNWYCFTVKNAGEYIVEKDGTSHIGIQLFNDMEFYTSKRYDNNNGSGSGGKAWFPTKELSPGLYWVRAYPGQTGVTGSYKIRVRTKPIELEANAGFASRTINTKEEDDWFDFTIKTPGEYVVETYGTAQAGMDLYTRDELAFRITYCNPTANGKLYRNLKAGEYSVKVKNYSGSGNYKIGLRNNPVKLTLNAAPISGSISVEGEIDWYDFTIDTPGQYVIETEGKTDILMYLYKSDNLSHAISSGYGVNEKIAYDFKTAGKYSVKVRRRHTNQTGDYKIGVKTQSLELTPNGTFTPGNVNAAGEEDWYDFTIDSVGEYAIETEGNANISIELYRSNNLASALPRASGANGEPVYNLKPGKYSAKVKNNSGSASYKIGVRTAPIELTLNAARTSGNISVPKEEDWYSFTINAPGQYAVETEGKTNVTMELYKSNNITSRISSGSGANGKIPYDFKTAGKYSIKVKHSSPSGTGHYKIGVRVQCVELTLNEARTSGSISVAKEEDWYDFTIDTPGEYAVETDENANVTMELYKSDDLSSALPGGSGANGKIAYDFKTAGKYSVKVKHSGTSSTGNYKIGVRTAPVELTLNEARTSGSISAVGEKDWYDFTIDTPGQYAIETEGTTDVTMDLYKRDNLGSPLPGGAGAKDKIVHDFQAGKYSVKVKHDGSSSGIVAYKIGVRVQPAELTLNATPTSETIQTQGGENWYRLTIASQKQYIIEAKAQTNLDISLYGPDDISAFISSSSGANGKITHVLDPGEYFVKVKSSDTVNYTIEFSQAKGIGGSTEPGKYYKINLKSKPNEDNKDTFLTIPDDDIFKGFKGDSYKGKVGQEWLITEDENISNKIKYDVALDIADSFTPTWKSVGLKKHDTNSQTQKWHLGDDGYLHNKSDSNFILIMVQYRPKKGDSQPPAWTFAATTISAFNALPYTYKKYYESWLLSYKTSTEWEFTEV